MSKLNKPWESMNHPIKEFKSPFVDVDGNPWSVDVNVGVYWGCRNCDYEALVSEVRHPSDGLCLDCRNELFNNTDIGVS